MLDYQGRRIRKVVYNWNTNTSAYYVGLDLKFLYDAWNLIAELNGTNANLICSYMWGTDLSGSMQGAGGVGGLLCVNHSQFGAQFSLYDGNGNVMGLVDAGDGASSASYEYEPFGKQLRKSGTAAALGFSSKYWDTESDLTYFGHRFYHPISGAWSSRDPISERGGKGLYRLVSNDPANSYDLLGLAGIFSWLYNVCHCPDLCPKEWKRKIDHVHPLILPANTSPTDYELAMAGVDAADAVGNVTLPIDPNIINHLTPSLKQIFDQATGGIMQKSFTTIYTTVEYSMCVKKSCSVFWRRLKWDDGHKDGPTQYSKGAFDPQLGYNGFRDAVDHLADAIAAHVKEVLDEGE